MSKWRVFVLIGSLMASGAAIAEPRPRGQPYVVDPVTQRIQAYCKGEPRCIRRQHKGIQTFLAEITQEPRPGFVRIQHCIDKATRKHMTDWGVAGRCLRTRSGGR